MLYFIVTLYLSSESRFCTPTLKLKIFPIAAFSVIGSISIRSASTGTAVLLVTDIFIGICSFMLPEISKKPLLNEAFSPNMVSLTCSVRPGCTFRPVRSIVAILDMSPMMVKLTSILLSLLFVIFTGISRKSPLLTRLLIDSGDMEYWSDCACAKLLNAIAKASKMHVSTAALVRLWLLIFRLLPHQFYRILNIVGNSFKNPVLSKYSCNFILVYDRKPSVILVEHYLVGHKQACALVDCLYGRVHYVHGLDFGKSFPAFVKFSHNILDCDNAHKLAVRLAKLLVHQCISFLCPCHLSGYFHNRLIPAHSQYVPVHYIADIWLSDRLHLLFLKQLVYKF